MSTEQLTQTYTIERLSATNLVDVEKLHKAVYGKMPKPGFFSKKYDTSFTGINHIGYLAYNADRLAIGYYGVIPCFIKMQDHIVLAAQSADTMTHPLHRYKGLFVELAELTYELCRNNGIKLLFGFPNQNSLPGAIHKLGWQMTEVMDVFIIKLPFGWQGLANKFSLTGWIYNIYLQQQLNKYTTPQKELAGSVLNDGFNGIYGNYDYLKYKTYSKSFFIKLGPATIWLKISHVLLIGDIVVEPKDFESTIIRLKKLAAKLGLKEIHFHACKGITLHQLFAAHFNAMPSFPVLFKALSDSWPLNEIKFTSGDIDTF